MTNELLERICGLPMYYDGRARPPARLEALADAERRCKLRLPDDLRQLLLHFDGTNAPFTLDHGWVILLSAEDLWPASAAGYPMVDNMLVFADHGLGALDYGIESYRPDTNPSRIFLLVEPTPQLIFPSLTDFLHGILDDDGRLYG